MQRRLPAAASAVLREALGRRLPLQPLSWPAAASAASGRALRARHLFSSGGGSEAQASESGGSSSSSGSGPAVAADAAADQGGAAWRWALAAAAAAPVVGTAAYWLTYGELPLAKEVTTDIKPIGDGVFETTDNLFVFFLDNSEGLVSRQADIQRIIRTLLDEPTLARVQFYYNITKEGDPPPPPAAASEEAATKSGRPPIRVMMYKGQRKAVLRIGDEVPREKIVEFFKLLSEELNQSSGAVAAVRRVNAESFDQDVVAASTPQQPILLQMFEDTCFLCFLMRPFVNSLGELFAKYQVPVTIRRLNIEKNDFPDRCPVARGTPTFVLFRGPQVAPVKWEEFKPKELVEKICQVFPMLPSEVQDKMDHLQGLVSKRFQLFTQLVMWTVELQKLESLILAGEASVAGAAGTAASAGDDSEEESGFNNVVMEMMQKDMRRLDNITDNLAHLQKEVDEVEHDALLLGASLADSVRRRELAEEAAWAAKTAKVV